jgi:hypothetical protein
MERIIQSNKDKGMDFDAPASRPPSKDVNDLVSQVASTKARRFLRAFSKCGSRREAARLAGCGENSHYMWYRQDHEYKKAFNWCLTRVADMLEDLCVERATDPRSKDNKLLFNLLKGAKPKKYADKGVNVNTHVQQGVSVDAGSAESLKKRIATIMENNRPRGEGQEQAFIDPEHVRVMSCMQNDQEEQTAEGTPD